MSEPWVLPDELRYLVEAGEQDLVTEVLAVFRSDTAERLKKAQRALEGKDLVTVRNEAHAMKGSAWQVGATQVAAICQRIEADAPGADPADLRDRLQKLEAAFDEVCRQMAS
jgi:HPt (histidine-containing phosphotransfer) domain-containing protein